MLLKQSVLPNFIRAIAIIAIASFSFTANAMHHEKDAKKAKSEHMQKATDKMHGDEMKDKMHGDEMKDALSDKYSGDLEEAEGAMEAAADTDEPE